MKRLNAYVSGKVQNVGYRTRVMALARALGLKGAIQNLDDGRVEIIAEGKDDDLELFLNIIDIKNNVIHVDSISKDYSEATGNFPASYKLMGANETDSRLDQGILILKEILATIKDRNADRGSKQD